MREILRRVHESDDGGAAMAAALGMEPPGRTAPGARDDSDSGDGGEAEDTVSQEAPLSAATLQRLLAAAQAAGPGGELEVHPAQLHPRELREFERFVASGQVHSACLRAE